MTAKSTGFQRSPERASLRANTSATFVLMQHRATIAMKAASICAAVLLLAATSVPALWTMKCYSMDRVVYMWGQAEDCMPERPVTDGAAVNVQCCAFSSIEAHMDDPPLCPVTNAPAPVLMAVLDAEHCTAIHARSISGSQGTAHGPPPLPAVVDLTAIGRLRI